MNAEIFDEYNDVLRRKNFKFDEQAVEIIIAGIIACDRKIVPAF